MNVMAREVYLKSNDYKVIQILSGYRHLFGMPGVELFNFAIRHRWLYMDDFFIQKVDTGFEQLDQDERVEYARTIADKLGYNVTEFYNALYDVAEECEFSSDEQANNLTIVNAIAKITELMQN